LSCDDATDSNLDIPQKPAYLVYFDSTDLHWCPDVGNSYVPCGDQPKVESPGKENPWRALFGSLIYPTGEGVYTIHERKRHQEVMAHLLHLMDYDPNGFYFVILDNASAHTPPLLDDFWKEHSERIEPVFLPTYSPHLSLIERLWGFMRGQMTRNHFYQTIEVLCQAVVGWLERLPFSSFCSLMGIDESTLEPAHS
jgi:hypothetical protein